VLVRRAGHNPVRAPRSPAERIYKRVRAGINMAVCNQPEGGKGQGRYGAKYVSLDIMERAYIYTPAQGNYTSERSIYATLDVFKSFH